MSERLRYEHAERVRDFYREQGAERERERIIKLFETAYSPAYGTKYIRSDIAIALIKGETNE